MQLFISAFLECDWAPPVDLWPSFGGQRSFDFQPSVDDELANFTFEAYFDGYFTDVLDLSGVFNLEDYEVGLGWRSDGFRVHCK